MSEIFLREDYDLMIENELKMARKAAVAAEDYLLRAEKEENAWYKHQAMSEATSHQQRAEHHREQANYWMRAVSEFKEVNDDALEGAQH